MDTKNIRTQKEEKLKEIIERLSATRLSGDAEIEKNLSELLWIYQGNYRHDYSIFFPILYELNADDSKGSIGTLSTNIQVLRKYIDNRFLDEIYGTYNTKYHQIIKLFDHLTLEGIRLETQLSNEKKFEDAKKAIEEASNTIQKLEEATNELEKARIKLEKANKQAKSAQKEFISILSIFAAVVLFFTIDSNYFTNAMAGMNNSSVFKIVFVACVCGIVLINGFYLLFDFIKKILYNDNSDTEKNSKIGKRLQNKPILYVNILIITIMIMDVVSWWLKIHNYFPFN